MKALARIELLPSSAYQNNSCSFSIYQGICTPAGQSYSLQTGKRNGGIGMGNLRYKSKLGRSYSKSGKRDGRVLSMR